MIVVFDVNTQSRLRLVTLAVQGAHLGFLSRCDGWIIGPSDSPCDHGPLDHMDNTLSEDSW